MRDKYRWNFRLGAALAEHGEMSRALGIVSELEVNSRNVVLRYNIAMATGDWHAVSTLVDEHLETFPKTERDPARAARIVATVELAAAQKRRSMFEEQRDNFTGNTRALTRLAECARRNGFEDLAKEYLALAQLALENGDNGFASCLSMAFEAMAQSNPGTTADVLFGSVSLDRDSLELQLLGQALIDDYPIRERAVRFFDHLGPDVRKLPCFQQLEGRLHIQRGAPKDAIGPFAAAFEQQPTIDNLMNLIVAHLMVGDKAVVAALLRRSDFDTLPGSALARIDFCQVLLDFGGSAQALDLGYRAVIEGLEYAPVVQKFLGLVLKFTQTGPQDFFDGIVASGVWVRLTQSHGDAYEALLGDTVDRPWGAKADPSNPFIVKALGRKVGDVFEHVNPVTGTTETWTIAGAKPHWLQAFHHLSKTFNQNFPASQGFASIAMAKGDVGPVFDLVRRRGEATRKLADLYLVHNLPLVVSASDSPGSAIAFAEYLASISEDLRVCDGTTKEGIEALALIEQHSRRGVVLDALTAWHAAILDVFPILSERLGKLAIPASEVRRLKAMLEHQELPVGKEKMRLAYQGGQYVRQIATAEEQNEQLTLIRSRIEDIENACINEPLVVPDKLSELGEELVGPPFGDAFAPAVIAGQNRLMLSDDMMMRQLAAKAYATKGVWLQAVLMSAVNAGKMPPDAYVDALVHLASHRHGIVTISASVLSMAFERDTSDELVQVQALCTYIGQRNAEPASHIALVADFINRIWRKGYSQDSKATKAMSLMFEALFGRDPTLKWTGWTASLYRQIDEAPRAYFLDWCREHSLPIGGI